MKQSRSNDNAALFRVESVQYAPYVDEWDQPFGTGRTELVCREFPVSRYTAKGAWVSIYGALKFVNLRAKKQFACASRDEAKAAFVFRKRRQIAILSGQLRHAQEALASANRENLYELTAF